MKFWDGCAIVPLCIEEPFSESSNPISTRKCFDITNVVIHNESL